MPHRRLARRIRLIGPHLGRRGMILATLGIVWIITGVATIIAPDPGSAYPLLSTGHTIRGTLWITTGTAAVICAHLPQGRDAPGWAALYPTLGVHALMAKRSVADPQLPGCY